MPASGTYAESDEGDDSLLLLFFWFLSCQVISRAAKRWMVSNSDCSSFHWTEVNMMGNRKYTQLFFAPIRIKGHWVIERTRKKVSFPIINISVHEMIDINIAFYDQTRLGMKVTRNNKMYLLFYSNFEIEYDFMLVKLGGFGNFCPIKRLCLPFRAYAPPFISIRFHRPFPQSS